MSPFLIWRDPTDPQPKRVFWLVLQTTSEEFKPISVDCWDQFFALSCINPLWMYKFLLTIQGHLYLLFHVLSYLLELKYVQIRSAKDFWNRGKLLNWSSSYTMKLTNVSWPCAIFSAFDRRTAIVFTICSLLFTQMPYFPILLEDIIDIGSSVFWHGYLKLANLCKNECTSAHFLKSFLSAFSLCELTQLNQYFGLYLILFLKKFS